MSDAEQIMSKVWDRIINEVRKMRNDKYTLERIGSILGVAKPTVQRWLENNAGGEKTAFIDVIRYLNALDIDLGELLFEEKIAAARADKNEAVSGLEAELLQTREENAKLAAELVNAQRGLLESQGKVIELQGKMLELEKYSAEVTEKARRVVAAAVTKKTESKASPAKRRLSPCQFPDLPPIHLHNGNE